MFSRLPALLAVFLSLSSTSAQAAEYRLRSLSGPRADVAVLILSGRESGALRVTGLAVADCISDSEATGGRVQLTVEIEGRSLLDAVASGDQAAVPESVRVELYAYVMTKAGEIVDSLSKWVRLPLMDLTTKLPGGGVKLVDELDLPPGEYQIRILVRETRSQQFALRVLDASVADPEVSRPFLNQPLFAESKEAWLLAASDSGALRASPSALPVLSTGDARGFVLDGCHLSDAAFDARLLTQNEKPVPQGRVRLETAAAAGPKQTVRGEIELEKMEAGLYLLEVTASSNRGESVQRLPVFVTGARGLSTWTAVGSLTAEPPATEENLDLAKTPGASKRVRAIAGAYEGALELLASGQLDSAVTRLERLERDVLEAAENPRRALKWLTEAENRATRQLLRRDPECLLPLITLHLELHGRFVELGEESLHLLNATRARIRSLAHVYATDAKQEMAAALSAKALAELARVLGESGQLVSSLVVLREALILDRSNTDVLLDLAYQYEHHQFRSEAIELLERLLEVDPRSDEGRLRLAMNLRHVGRDNEARSLLRQVIANGSIEWVLAVAYQELAHDLMRRERFDEAVALLEAAVLRMPQIQRLHLELAYALDRSGRRKRGREVVADLPAANGQPSPRLLYRIPDRGDGLGSRAELVRHATARLPLLATALAESEASR